jgi:hypothetical protein
MFAWRRACSCFSEPAVAARLRLARHGQTWRELAAAAERAVEAKLPGKALNVYRTREEQF